MKTKLEQPVVMTDQNALAVRDEIARRTPRCVQRLITIISGCAPRNTKPAVVWTTPRIASVVVIWLLCSIAASWTIVAAGPTWMWLALPATIISTTGAARAVMTTILHDLTHAVEQARANGERARWTLIAGEALSALLHIQHFGDPGGYVDDHLEHHKEHVFLSERDPDVVFLRSIGIFPRSGSTAASLRAQLLWTLVSPSFHWRFAGARLASTFYNASLRVCGARIVLSAVVLACVVQSGSWVPFLLAVVFPLGPVLHAAALLQFSSEHRWLVRPTERPRQDPTDTSRPVGNQT
jgi:hypothetical protein